MNKLNTCINSFIVRKSYRKGLTIMQMAKLSSKGQVTIPSAIRQSLNLKAGDTLVWDIKENDTITVRRVKPVDIEYLSALSDTLSEWNSEEDETAYHDL